jgi:hypothetical protein
MQTERDNKFDYVLNTLKGLQNFSHDDCTKKIMTKLIEELENKSVKMLRRRRLTIGDLISPIADYFFKDGSTAFHKNEYYRIMMPFVVTQGGDKGIVVDNGGEEHELPYEELDKFYVFGKI